jgi:antitoxin component YwqK of YwqJK toxin-antitoxin module
MLTGDFVDGARDGLWEGFTPSGDREWICLYENDRGEYKSWRADGSVLARGHYQGALPVGVWTSYRPNGSKESEGEYVDGRRHGVWTEWTDTDPPTLVKTEYRYGERIR